MKNFLFVLLILFSFNVFAGNNSFSIKAGVNYSTLAVDYELNTADYYRIDTSYNLGGEFFFSWKFNNVFTQKLYLNMEFGVNKKGIAYDYKSSTAELYDIEKYYLTLEIPIILGYQILKSLNLYGGLYYSQVFYIGSSKGNGRFQITDEVGHKNLLFDAGVILGIEYEYNNIIFDFRFEQGLPPLRYKTRDEDVTHSFEKSRQFMFMIGYKFF